MELLLGGKHKYVLNIAINNGRRVVGFDFTEIALSTSSLLYFEWNCCRVVNMAANNAFNEGLNLVS